MTDEQKLFLALHYGGNNEPEATFNYLYNKYKNLLIFIASGYLTNDLDVDDAVEEAFINFFSKAAKVNSNIKAYLTKTTKNICLNMLKKNKKLVYVEDQSLDYVKDSNLNLENQSLKYLILDMEKCLTKEEIKIILMHLLEDLTFKALAIRLNSNERTIKTKYYRALKKYQRVRRISNEENWKRIFKWF